MAAHIEVDLLGKALHRSPMVVECDRCRLVAAVIATCEQSVPIFRIARTAGLADVEPFVEQPGSLEDLASERHARAGTDLPGREHLAAHCRELGGAEGAGHITLPETPEGLEMPLRLCRD